MKNLLKKSIISLGLLGLIAQASLAQSYIYEDTSLTNNGKEAQLFVGVPVEVKKELKDELEVVIKGYKFKNKVYSSESKELLVATLNDGFKVVDKGGNKVELLGKISKDTISDDLFDVWGEQEEFYFEMCTQCHAGPEVNHHTMMEWGAIFGTMKGFAKLSEEESSYLLRYLKANSSDGFVKTEH